MAGTEQGGRCSLSGRYSAIEDGRESQAKTQVIFQAKTQAKIVLLNWAPDAKIAMFCKEFQKGTRSWDRCSTFALKKINEDAAKQSTTSVITDAEEDLQEEVRERLQEVYENYSEEISSETKLYFMQDGDAAEGDGEAGAVCVETGCPKSTEV